MTDYNKIVYETSVSEIEKLNKVTLQDLKDNPYLLKVSQSKNRS